MTGRIFPAAAVLAVAATLVCAAACSRGRGAPDDAARVREHWALPDSARVVSLRATPPVGGTFGREGLRVVATFSMPPADAAAWVAAHRPADWRAPPVAPAVLAWRAGPAEVAAAPGAAWTVRVGAYDAGPDAPVWTPAARAPSHWWAGRVDTTTGTFTSVFHANY